MLTDIFRYCAVYSKLLCYNIFFQYRSCWVYYIWRKFQAKKTYSYKKIKQRATSLNSVVSPSFCTDNNLLDYLYKWKLVPTCQLIWQMMIIWRRTLKSILLWMNGRSIVQEPYQLNLICEYFNLTKNDIVTCRQRKFNFLKFPVSNPSLFLKITRIYLATPQEWIARYSVYRTRIINMKWKKWSCSKHFQQSNCSRTPGEIQLFFYSPIFRAPFMVVWFSWRAIYLFYPGEMKCKAFIT